MDWPRWEAKHVHTGTYFNLREVQIIALRLAMQAAVNADCLFVDLEVGFKGPTHDSTILKSSALGAYILTLAGTAWGVLADAIYELGRNLWTPFRGKPEEQPIYMRKFNKAHSRARIHVSAHQAPSLLAVTVSRAG